MVFGIWHSGTLFVNPWRSDRCCRQVGERLPALKDVLFSHQPCESGNRYPKSLAQLLQLHYLPTTRWHDRVCFSLVITRCIQITETGLEAFPVPLAAASRLSPPIWWRSNPSDLESHDDFIISTLICNPSHARLTATNGEGK
ncbi:hypothetical protein TWF569_011958 [Orbilia oligospora]|uniref:Uncharacterized protein n=1 Tax=Orbilia oligospora TaxID=2813651 RepID=A0A7C8NDG9_ORBOL|nr:hypothetical protein TWF102_012024 [Orbilia oligospora]KAF3093714.1 hypothetical protein TWF103_012027 [Orbilia oligospora]KAF3114895.1 hypothetical protein TWF706_012010 [Orbilia oligospora]KAF3150693.1 hypothetical protein TWF569_011958 [Orbilia oligospora]